MATETELDSLKEIVQNLSHCVSDDIIKSSLGTKRPQEIKRFLQRHIHRCLIRDLDELWLNFDTNTKLKHLHDLQSTCPPEKLGNPLLD